MRSTPRYIKGKNDKKAFEKKMVETNQNVFGRGGHLKTRKLRGKLLSPQKKNKESSKRSWEELLEMSVNSLISENHYWFQYYQRYRKFLKTLQSTFFADVTTVYTENKVSGQKFIEKLIATKNWFLKSGLTLNTNKM